MLAWGTMIIGRRSRLFFLQIPSVKVVEALVLNHKANLAFSVLAIAGCTSLLPATHSGISLFLKPSISEGFLTQATVLPYAKANIDHLSIKLLQGTTEIAAKTLLQSQLDNSIVFTSLKANTTYNIKAYAYLADNTLISNEASSSLSFTTTTDDRPSIASLPVQLIDRNFNGQGTGSIQVSNGGYLNGDPIDGQVYTRIIETVAGNGTCSFSGDNTAASSASLNTPRGIAFDSQGNLYFADSGTHRVRKVNKLTGLISTVAGNGTASYNGDNIPATSANLYNPWGIAIDSQNNLFITDFNNHRIRKVDTNGVISTVAGGAASGFSGDGGPATSALLNLPRSVAFDVQGNLFIADTDNFRVRKVATNGTISTVAGNGATSLSGNGLVATNAALYRPEGMAVDAQGNLYIAEHYGNRVRKVDTNGIITTAAGNGSPAYTADGGMATASSFNSVSSVAVDAQGRIYFVNKNNSRIRMVDTSGVLLTIAGIGSAAFSGDGGPATAACLNYPRDIVFDAQGNLYISDETNHRIRRLRWQ